MSTYGVRGFGVQLPHWSQDVMFSAQESHKLRLVFLGLGFRVEGSLTSTSGVAGLGLPDKGSPELNREPEAENRSTAPEAKHLRQHSWHPKPLNPKWGPLIDLSLVEEGCEEDLSQRTSLNPNTSRGMHQQNPIKPKPSTLNPKSLTVWGLRSSLWEGELLQGAAPCSFLNLMGA